MMAFSKLNQKEMDAVKYLTFQLRGSKALVAGAMARRDLARFLADSVDADLNHADVLRYEAAERLEELCLAMITELDQRRP